MVRARRARVEDVAIKDGVVSARGRDLPREAAAQCIDANNQWLLPGMLDIHTHLDLEVEVRTSAGGGCSTRNDDGAGG
jgi:N-acyl-D-aspartate/D-glutamate deacylase